MPPSNTLNENATHRTGLADLPIEVLRRIMKLANQPDFNDDNGRRAWFYRSTSLVCQTLRYISQEELLHHLDLNVFYGNSLVTTLHNCPRLANHVKCVNFDWACLSTILSKSTSPDRQPFGQISLYAELLASCATLKCVRLCLVKEIEPSAPGFLIPRAHARRAVEQLARFQHLSVESLSIISDDCEEVPAWCARLLLKAFPSVLKLSITCKTLLSAMQDTHRVL